MLVCALWFADAQPVGDLEVCLRSVQSDCMEVCGESGGLDEHGRSICHPEVYEACLKQREPACYERFLEKPNG